MVNIFSNKKQKPYMPHELVYKCRELYKEGVREFNKQWTDMTNIITKYDDNVSLNKYVFEYIDKNEDGNKLLDIFVEHYSKDIDSTLFLDDLWNDNLIVFDSDKLKFDEDIINALKEPLEVIKPVLVNDGHSDEEVYNAFNYGCALVEPIAYQFGRKGIEFCEVWAYSDGYISLVSYICTGEL